jgi:hypothetical protein
LLFIRPPVADGIYRRRGVAAFGLFLYAVTATVASVDWAMTVEPDWFSAEYGLLFMTTQAAIAVSVAVLMAGSAWRRAEPEVGASFLLVAAAGWLFMHFMQYLVIWSADKPSDITWYLNRGNAGGESIAWLGVIAGFVIPSATLMAPAGRRHPIMLPTAAILVLVAQAMGMLFLITPSLRGAFTISGMAITLGVCLLARPVEHV